MKRIIILSLILTTSIFAHINVVVSILPEKTFVERIGGEKVDVSLMVLPGNSPHTYEPKPSQMKEIAKATLYAAIGVEFEAVWLPKFKSLNPHMSIVDLTKGIQKRAMQTPLQAHTNIASELKRKNLDPHVWTAPDNVKIIAQNIYAALSKADPENQEYYRKNLTLFLHRIAQTDQKIRTLLKALPKGSTFMVFHPSWGYFADAYGLIQLPMELEGKSPKPRELIRLIKEAKKEKIKAIFTQPEFSDTIAKMMADELGIEVIRVSPMSAKWSETLLIVARAVAGRV